MTRILKLALQTVDRNYLVKIVIQCTLLFLQPTKIPIKLDLIRDFSTAFFHLNISSVLFDQTFDEVCIDVVTAWDSRIVGEGYPGVVERKDVLHRNIAVNWDILRPHKALMRIKENIRMNTLKGSVSRDWDGLNLYQKKDLEKLERRGWVSIVIEVRARRYFRNTHFAALFWAF